MSHNQRQTAQAHLSRRLLSICALRVVLNFRSIFAQFRSIFVSLANARLTSRPKGPASQSHEGVWRPGSVAARAFPCPPLPALCPALPCPALPCLALPCLALLRVGVAERPLHGQRGQRAMQRGKEGRTEGEGEEREGRARQTQASVRGPTAWTPLCLHCRGPFLHSLPTAVGFCMSHGGSSKPWTSHRSRTPREERASCRHGWSVTHLFFARHRQQQQPRALAASLSFHSPTHEPNSSACSTCVCVHHVPLQSASAVDAAALLEHQQSQPRPCLPHRPVCRSVPRCRKHVTSRGRAACPAASADIDADADTADTVGHATVLHAWCTAPVGPAVLAAGTACLCCTNTLRGTTRVQPTRAIPFPAYGR
jgi:hypothetical protein